MVEALFEPLASALARHPSDIGSRRWKELNPDTQIKDYRNFRTYFTRGDAAVKELNFGWPRLGERSKVSSTQQILTEQSEGWTVEIPYGVSE